MKRYKPEKIYFHDWIYNFEDMYVYASPLRRKKSFNDRRPDMSLLTFHEIKRIKGELRIWDVQKRQWIGLYWTKNMNEEVEQLYINYIIERDVLGGHK